MGLGFLMAEGFHESLELFLNSNSLSLPWHTFLRYLLGALWNLVGPLWNLCGTFLGPCGTFVEPSMCFVEPFGGFVEPSRGCASGSAAAAGSPSILSSGAGSQLAGQTFKKSFPNFRVSQNILRNCEFRVPFLIQ